MKQGVIVILLLVCGSAFSQRPVLSGDDVTAEVIREIDEVFQSDDFRKKKDKKFPEVRGSIVVDIGVVQKGKVSTFFKVESDIKDIDFINFMSDYILKHKFRFKLPAGQRCKIRYTATF